MLDKYTDTSNAMLEEAQKFFEKGNKSAGTRARLLCQELKQQLQTIRAAITKLKKEK
jgi:hypothetical protein